MYKIKETPEDFVVKEITNVKAEEKGSYSYFWLKKRDYTTVKAVEKVAERLRIPVKNIGFAGSKDKRAVTEQLISIKNCGVKGLELKDIKLKYFGKGINPISLGDLKGNEFVITVKDYGKINDKIRDIPNYFDEQRFSKNNAEVGKAIVKKDFKNAVELILENKGDFEEKLRGYLKQKPTDYIGALRKINKKILKLYIHAYQSYIFNETVNQYLKIKTINTENIINKELTIEKDIIKNKIKKKKIPIIGFGSEIKDEEIKKIVDGILEKEGINLRDFIIPQIPELSSEGIDRELFIDVKDFKIVEKEKDKIVLSFSLPKGAYATIVVKNLFNL
jgi:tRNA pseudouridine13 synthase